MALRTDLAIESHEHYKGEGVRVSEEMYDGVSVTTVYVETQEAAERLSKPVGEYITIRANNILYDTNEYTAAVNAIAKAVNKLSNGAENVLVAGLGNRDITPDSLGPEVVSRVFVT
ncbi:MAG: GPR endopeptidase, partial [Clostridia bacterium]|nr:GPR endopeptidase [Clostridia bacterium]